MLGTLFSGPALAGSDAQLWMEAGVRYRPAKKVRLTLTQNFRMAENISRTDSLKTDLEADWRATKGMRIGWGYRFSMEANKKGVLKPSHRLHIQAHAFDKFGPVKLSYRLRFQEGIEPDDDQIDLTHTLRNRVGATFDTDTDFTPGLSVELFNRLADKEAFQFQKLRVTTGLEIKPAKPHSINLYYRVQFPVYDPTDPTEHIIGLGYQYQVRRKKKKKGKS